MSAKAEERKPPTIAQACAAQRRDFGLALRRRRRRGAKDAETAYRRVVERSSLTPEQHVDALMGALMAAHPEASVLEICSWFDPGILRRELGDHYDVSASHPGVTAELASKTRSHRGDSRARVIIGNSGSKVVAPTPGPARNEGGSDR